MEISAVIHRRRATDELPGGGREGGEGVLLANLSEVLFCEETDLDGQILKHEADGEWEEQDPHELVAGVGPTLQRGRWEICKFTKPGGQPQGFQGRHTQSRPGIQHQSIAGNSAKMRVVVLGYGESWELKHVTQVIVKGYLVVSCSFSLLLTDWRQEEVFDGW
jgi:hypothetical protein